MLSARYSATDVAINLGGGFGNFELNVFPAARDRISCTVRPACVMAAVNFDALCAAASES